jgi:hypothetical protein
LLPALAAFFNAALLAQAEAQLDLACSLQEVPLALSAQAFAQFSPACKAGTRAKAATVRDSISFFMVFDVLFGFGCKR